MDQLAATVIQSLQTVTMPELDYYWEEFGNIRKPGCILAVSRNQQIGLNQLTIDGGNTVATEQIITRSFYPEVNNGNLSTNRLIRGAFRSQVRLSAFAGTTPDSPISAVSGNNIKVYHDGKFIVSKLRVSYVRKPAKISLLLNQNCDLAPEFHREICDRVVLDIKELTLSPDWEVRLRDLMMNKD